MMKQMSILLLILVFVSSTIKTSFGEREISNLHETKIQRQLKRLNKPAIKSIRSPDGDIIDCVHFTNQPAFDHPLLKNHTLQRRPSFRPKDVLWRNEEPPKPLTQLWHMNGKCPKDTIPIRRTRKEDLLRWNSIEHYGKKYINHIPKFRSNMTINNNQDEHEYVTMVVEKAGKYYGGGAKINVWKPYVEANEFSLTQMWIQGGIGLDSNTIETGWQVYPEKYGDNNPKLFIYWTADGYRKTGCYNLACQGFVQTSDDVALGGSIDHFSTYNGSQYEINIFIYKEPENGHWWLEFNEKRIGYWPKEIFTYLKDHAWNVQWGGEIVNLKKDGRQHTTTDMGSGHFAEEGHKKASYIKQIVIVDESNTKRNAQGDGFTFSNDNCYNFFNGSQDPNFGTYFYYGGPGRNPNCK